MASRPDYRRMASANSIRLRERHHIRRLSAMSNSDDIQDGPVVVVPERLLKPTSEPQAKNHKRRSTGGIFAAELSSAREDLKNIDLENEVSSELTPIQSIPSTPPSLTDAGDTTPGDSDDSLDDIPSEDTYAFAFDIDGVLIRGGRPIPEAIEAMRMLNGENEYGIKVPYIFLTNGGGKTEAERCLDLSRQLDIEVSPAQFICGHTPMREMVEKYQTVLVVGGEGEKCRQVAQGYGFKDVVTPGDIIKDNKHTTPFRQLTAEEEANSKSRDFSQTKIEAVFVFADSRDWAGDVQIMLDVAMSKGGYIGTLSETFDEGPPIYFAHNDVVWSAAHDNVRLGMGALRKMTEMLFKDLTKGKELETIAFGKPQIGTFEFATRLLQQWRREAHCVNRPPETVYFVGDTPESDIKGTNLYNKKAPNDWYSILVETGVYQHGTEPAHTPRVTVENVLEAVKHGMKREFERKAANAAKKSAAIGSDSLEKKLENVHMSNPSPIEEVSEPATPVVVD